jgi:LysM repeat protein
MSRDVKRFSGWFGLVLLLALVLVPGCTRAKSSGPPEPTEADAAMNATTTALAATATARIAATATPTPKPVEPAVLTQSPTTQTPGVSPTPQPTQPTATQTPQATQAPAPATVPVVTQPPVSTGGGTHTVQPGENLFRIALKYGLTYQELAAHNGIANPNFIVVGQVLRIPGGGAPVITPVPGGARYHIVQQGENLFRIALNYNMPFTALAAANGLTYPYTIYPGQQLIIP